MDERTQDERVGAAVRGAGTAAWFLAVIVFNVLLIGFIAAPVVREHCTSGGGVSELSIKSGWRFGIPPWISQDKLFDDGTYCVRNTPSRELLSLAGVWQLGEPRDQVEESLVGQASAVDEDSGDYVSELVKLRRQSEVSGRAFERMLKRADGPEDVLAAFATKRDSQNEVARSLKDLDPPPEFKEFHRTAIRLNEKSAAAADEVMAAIRFGDQAEIRRAALGFDDVQRELLQEFAELQQEAP